jgi:hypothetical protein
MIDLTKIKKFPVIGFSRQGDMVTINGPSDPQAMKFYTISLYRYNFSYIVGSNGRKYLDDECQADITQVLVPQGELLEAQKELQETKKALDVTIYNSNIFEKELSVSIQKRVGLLKELKETQQILETSAIKLHEAKINRDHFYIKLQELEATKKNLESTKAELEATKQELKGTKISREDAFSKVEELIRTNNFLREKYGFLQFP